MGNKALWRRGLARLPALQWLRGYQRQTLTSDVLAAVVVTLLLIPQSLAYALLAGLPAQAGLYASVAPLVLYALWGTSRVLAVGPVAVLSLMTAAAIGEHATPGTPAYWAVALTLAFLSGLMLLALGLLRLGFLANFLSYPVISAFVTASGLLIAANQLHALLGIAPSHHAIPQRLAGLAQQLEQTHALTLGIGVATLVFLLWARRGLRAGLLRWGLRERLADTLVKLAPVMALALTLALAWALDWPGAGVKVVGRVPQGLPSMTLPVLDLALWRELAVPALLISVVGFVGSVSVGQTLAARRRQRIDPNQELVALGASNLGAAFCGGFPVSGGFARSAVNAQAGAQTPAAGVFTAVGFVLVSLLLTPTLQYLPQVSLAATIMVSVLPLMDFSILVRTWRYARADFLAALTTLAATVLQGVEAGLLAGVTLSLALFLLRTSRPHMAEVGLVPGTQHFRNVRRHTVHTSPGLLSLRVDESLYFANCRALEDFVNDAVASRPALAHVILQCSAINDVDASALQSLQAIDQRLQASGMRLHLSEVKGPVMDRLQRSGFLRRLSGQVFLTHWQAVCALDPQGR